MCELFLKPFLNQGKNLQETSIQNDWQRIPKPLLQE